ncbi:MAG: T9SS type A sorting domain-containing protein [Saprospiraceae bacterium]|nr:T9SS type A sorting domain-containing protein [Saprospiraceae bacterium]
MKTKTKISIKTGKPNFPKLKRLLISLCAVIVLILFSTAELFSQSTCGTAVTMNINKKKEFNITSSIFWIKFNPTQDILSIAIDKSSNNPSATIEKVVLYEGNCLNLLAIDSFIISNYDSVFFASNLTISNSYYLKICLPAASLMNCYGKFKLGIFDLLSLGGSKAPCCPQTPTCNLVPNGNLDQSNYTGTVSFDISSFYSCLYNNNVCGWAAANLSPQLKGPAANPRIWMWANNSNREAIYTQLNSGNSLTEGSYFLRMNYQEESVGLTNLIARLSNSTTYTSGNVVMNEAMSGLAAFVWTQTTPVVVNITPANQNDLYLIIYPQGTATPISCIAIDEIEFIPFLSSITGPGVICDGDNANLTAEVCLNDETFIPSYQWASNPVGFTSGLQTVNVSPTVTTTYTVTVTYSGYAGSQVASHVVTVNPKPDEPDVTGRNNMCDPPLSVIDYTINNYNPALNLNYSCTINYIGSPSINIPVTNPPIIQIDWNNYPPPVGSQNRAIITVVATDPNTGCSNETSFPVYGCCDNFQQYSQIFTEQTFPTNPTSYGYEQININGTVIIDNMNLMINNSDIYLGGDAKIVITPGSSLTLESCTLRSCDGFNMWDGIYIESEDANLIAVSSVFYDAKNTIVSQNGGIYDLSDNTFDLCYKDLIVEQYNGDHQGTIINNNFYCTSPIALYPHSGQSALYGIQLTDVVKINSTGQIKLGDASSVNYKNRFLNLDYGVYSVNSDFILRNAQFSNCDEGINFTGNDNIPYTNLARDVIIGGSATNQYIFMSNCAKGIVGTAKADIQIYNNFIDESDIGIEIFSTIDNDINIVENDLTNIHLKGIYMGGLTSILHVQNNTISPTSTLGYLTMGIVVYGNDIITFPSGGITASTFICNNTIGSSVRGIILGTNVKMYVEDNNIEVSHAWPTTGISVGITMQDSYGYLIHNEIFTSATYTPTANDIQNLLGIYVSHSFTYLKGNELSRLGSGTYIFKQSYCEFIRNEYYSNWDGIYLDKADINDQGMANMPGDNVWDNNHTYRLDGTFIPSIINPTLEWYYDPTFISGALDGDVNPYNSLTTPPFYPLSTTSGGQSYLPMCPGPPQAPFLAPPSSKSVVNLDSLRNIEVGSLIGNFMPLSPSSYISTKPKINIYSLPKNYMKAWMAFNLMQQKPQYANLNNGNDVIYQHFFNTMANSNIGEFCKAENYSKVGDVNKSEAILNSIVPQNLFEFNYLEVLKIFNKTFAKGIYSIAQQDVTTLQGIAYTSPEVGGLGVYFARNMLRISLIDISASTSKSKQDSTQNIIQNNLNAVNVMPNPTSGLCDFYFTNDIDGKLFIKVFDIRGRLLLSEEYVNQNKIQIDISSFDKGVYIYNIFNNDKIIQNGKLIKK